jgi:CheY-like chemotaxis protein
MTEAKPRILIADDERNIRKNLALVLEAAGYLVEVAEDGDKALDYYASKAILRSLLWISTCPT